MMQFFLWILVFLTTFSVMEFMAWFTHKYIMHGFLWSLHKDHHHKDHGSWWERNDAFFYFLCHGQYPMLYQLEALWLLARITHWIGYFCLRNCLFFGA